MNLLEILKYDALHNQNGIALDEMIEAYNELKEEGFQLYRQDKTIFMAKVVDGLVFYHTINAAPRYEYIDNLNKFFTLLHLKNFKAAYTTLENPKLKSFVKRYLKNTVVVEDKAITYLKT